MPLCFRCNKHIWELLDDIDTAGDMFKPKIDNYFKYVNQKVNKRHELLTSDGYNLYRENEKVESCNNDLMSFNATPTSKEAK